MSSYPGVLQTIRAPIRHYRSARLSRVRTPASYQKYPSEPVAAVLTPFDEVYDDKTLWIAKLPPKAARSSSPDLPWSGLKYAKRGNKYARNKSALADNIQTLVFHLTSKPRSRGRRSHQCFYRTPFRPKTFILSTATRSSLGYFCHRSCFFIVYWQASTCTYAGYGNKRLERQASRRVSGPPSCLQGTRNAGNEAKATHDRSVHGSGSGCG